MTEIPADIRARVLSDFGEDDAPVVEQRLLELMVVLQRYMVGEGLRVARCVVQYADGDNEKLEYALDIAQRDYRDAIMFGEYETKDHKLLRVRDLTQPFEL